MPDPTAVPVPRLDWHAPSLEVVDVRRTAAGIGIDDDLVILGSAMGS